MIVPGYKLSDMILFGKIGNGDKIKYVDDDTEIGYGTMLKNGTILNVVICKTVFLLEYEDEDEYNVILAEDLNDYRLVTKDFKILEGGIENDS